MDDKVVLKETIILTEDTSSPKLTKKGDTGKQTSSVDTISPEKAKKKDVGKGLFGMFKKADSEEKIKDENEDKIPLSPEELLKIRKNTDSFLKDEIDKFHDVRPQIPRKEQMDDTVVLKETIILTKDTSSPKLTKKGDSGKQTSSVDSISQKKAKKKDVGKGLFGIFKKAESEERIKDEKEDKISLSPEELLKIRKNTDSFLKDEIDKFHDVRPQIPSKEQEKDTVILKETIILTEETSSPKLAKKGDHGKKPIFVDTTSATKVKKKDLGKGLFGVFKKADSEEKVKEVKEYKHRLSSEELLKIRQDTNSFLKDEIDKFHDVRPQIANKEHKEGTVILKDNIILTEETSSPKLAKKDDTGKETISVEAGSSPKAKKKDGGKNLFGIFKKADTEAKGKEVGEEKHPLFPEDILKIKKDTDSFLKDEVDTFHDVRPQIPSKKQKDGTVILKETIILTKGTLSPKSHNKEDVREEEVSVVFKKVDHSTQVKDLEAGIKDRTVEEIIENRSQTDSFLRHEVDRYHDVRPQVIKISEDVVKEFISGDRSSPKIAKRKSLSKGLFGLFHKASSEDTEKDVKKPAEVTSVEDIIKIINETDCFLKDEVEKYHDVRPQIIKKEKPVTETAVSEETIHEVESSPKTAKKKNLGKGLFGLFHKESSEDKEKGIKDKEYVLSPKELIKIRQDTDAFLQDEVNRYHDVRPLTKDKEIMREEPTILKETIVMSEETSSTKLDKQKTAEKGMLFGIFRKTKHEETEKRPEELAEIVSVEDIIKIICDTDSFLKDEIDKYHDVRPKIFTQEKDSDKIDEVITIKKTMSEEDSAPKKGKGKGLFGVFKKAGSQDKDREPKDHPPLHSAEEVLKLRNDTDTFLAEEIDKYHDVRPQVAHKSKRDEDTGETVILKETTILAGETSSPKSGRKKDTEKGGLFGIFKKSEHVEQDKKMQSAVTPERDIIEILNDTDSFLRDEIEKYHDVRPQIIRKADKIDGDITVIKETVSVEATSPKPAKKKDTGKGLFGFFKKGDSEEKGKEPKQEQYPSEDILKIKKDTNSFLKDEIDKYHDVRPQVTAKKEKDDLKEEAVILKETIVLTEGASQPKSVTREDVGKGGLFGIFKKAGSEHKEKPLKDKEHVVSPEELIKIRKDTDTFLADEINEYHDVRPQIAEKIVTKEVKVEPTVLKETIVLTEEKSSPKTGRTKHVGKGLFGIFRKTEHGESEKYPQESVFTVEDSLKIINDTDTFLNDEIDKYHDVRPQIIKNGKETETTEELIVKEGDGGSPRNVKKKDAGKGLLGIFKKTGSEDKEIIAETKRIQQTEELIKIRNDTDSFLKDEIRKYHDVRPQVVEKNKDQANGETIIFKETIVLTEEKVIPKSPKKEDDEKGGLRGILKKARPEHILKDSDEFDVEFIKDTDHFLNTEVEKYHDVRPQIVGKIKVFEGEQPVLMKETIMKDEQSQKSSKHDDKEKHGFFSLFKGKNSEHRPEDKKNIVLSEEAVKIMNDTNSFLQDEIDRYHDVRPQITLPQEGDIDKTVLKAVASSPKTAKKKDVGKGLFGLFHKAGSEDKEKVSKEVIHPETVRVDTAEGIEEVEKRPVVVKETIILSEEKQSAEAPKKEDKVKGGLFGFFRKTDSEDKSTEPKNVVLSPELVKAMGDTNSFLLEEIEKYHDVRPLIPDKKEESDKFVIEAVQKEDLSPKTVTPKDTAKGFFGLFKHTDSEETKQISANQEFYKTIDDTNSFLNGEIEKYHDVHPQIKSDYIVEVTKEPIILKERIVIREEIIPKDKDEKLQTTTDTEEIKKGLYTSEDTAQAMKDSDVFLENEIEKYHDVRPLVPLTGTTVETKKKDTGRGIFSVFKKGPSEEKESIKIDEIHDTSKTSKKKDSGKGGLFGIFRKSGSEEKEKEIHRKEIIISETAVKTMDDTDHFLKDEVEKYHDVRPHITHTKEKVEQTKNENVIVKETVVLSEHSMKDDGRQSKDKGKYHTEQITIIFPEETIAIMNGTDSFLKDEIKQYHDVRPILERPEDIRAVKENITASEGVLHKTPKKKGLFGSFKKDASEEVEGESKSHEDNVPLDKHIKVLTDTDSFLKGEVDEYHDAQPKITTEKLAEEAPPDLKDTILIKEEISEQKLKETVPKDTPVDLNQRVTDKNKPEKIQPPLSETTISEMLVTSNFIRDEVANYHDMRPVSGPGLEPVKPDKSAKTGKLFRIFSRKSQDRDTSQERESKEQKSKKKSKKEKEILESKDFSKRETDRSPEEDHQKKRHSKEEGGHFFGLFSKKTKPQEKPTEIDGQPNLSEETLRNMEQTQDFLQTEKNKYHDSCILPENVLTSTEIFEPIQMVPLGLSESVLKNMTNSNKFIHEESDGISEEILVEIKAKPLATEKPRVEDNDESPKRVVTTTVRTEPIPDGERTTRVTTEVLTGTIQLETDVMSDLTKLEEEINVKLNQLRKETSTLDDNNIQHAEYTTSDVKPTEIFKASIETPQKQETITISTTSGIPHQIFDKKYISDNDVKKIDDESLPGVYRVIETEKDDTSRQVGVELSEQTVKNMQDTNNFLLVELEQYEDGKPELTTDLDDDVEKSKSSGLFGIFSKKGKSESPKVSQKKKKTQKTAKSLDEPDLKKPVEKISKEQQRAHSEEKDADELMEKEDKVTKKSKRFFDKLGGKISGRNDASASKESLDQETKPGKDSGKKSTEKKEKKPKKTSFFTKLGEKIGVKGDDTHVAQTSDPADESKLKEKGIKPIEATAKLDKQPSVSFVNELIQSFDDKMEHVKQIDPNSKEPVKTSKTNVDPFIQQEITEIEKQRETIQNSSKAALEKAIEDDTESFIKTVDQKFSETMKLTEQFEKKSKQAAKIEHANREKMLEDEFKHIKSDIEQLNQDITLTSKEVKEKLDSKIGRIKDDTEVGIACTVQNVEDAARIANERIQKVDGSAKVSGTKVKSKADKVMDNIEDHVKVVAIETDKQPKTEETEHISSSTNIFDTGEGPSRIITSTVTKKSIPHGERTTKITTELITGSIQLKPEVLTDLTKLEEEINEKLNQLRQETSALYEAKTEHKEETLTKVKPDIKLPEAETSRKKQGEIKQKTVDYADSESLHPEDSSKMTRTRSDYGGHMKDVIDTSRKISEANIDLSNLPTNVDDYSPRSDKKSSSYVTSPTLARRAFSTHFPKGERPKVVEVHDQGKIEAYSDDAYIVTEPDDTQSKVEKNKQLFHIQSEETDSNIENLISDLNKTIQEPTSQLKSSIKKEERKLAEQIKESRVDVDIIEQKLRDLDKALDSLEQIDIDVERTNDDPKIEKNMRRVERKFDKMASQVIQKDTSDAKQAQQLTSPEIEEKRETDYRTLVSQLSTEEISDFQKDYSHLWDEHTFSKSSDRESKTPDSQADAQELPQGDEVPSASAKEATTSTGRAEGEETAEGEEHGYERKVTDQHQLSEEMKKLLKELEKESKQ